MAHMAHIIKGIDHVHVQEIAVVGAEGVVVVVGAGVGAVEGIGVGVEGELVVNCDQVDGNIADSTSTLL